MEIRPTLPAVYLPSAWPPSPLNRDKAEERRPPTPTDEAQNTKRPTDNEPGKPRPLHPARNLSLPANTSHPARQALTRYMDTANLDGTELMSRIDEWV